jgi:hypothetical protein
VLFQCPDCRRLLEVERARVTDDKVWLRCSACDAEIALDRANPATGDEHIAIRKEAIKEELANPSGSATKRASALAQKLMDLPTADDERAVADRFLELLDTWDDDKAHEKAIKHAASSGQLAALGQRYRVVLDERPGDGRAIAAQQRIIGAAMATMTPASFSVSKSNESPSGRLILLAVIGLLVVGGLLFFWVKYIGGMS